MIITNWDIVSSLAVTLSADGTNESLYLNPTGTGKVVVGGDSLVVATKTSAPSSPSAGQIYFDTALGQFRGYTGSDWVDLSEAVPSFPVAGLVSYWKFNSDAADEYSSNDLTNNNSTAYATGIINNGTDLERSSTNYFNIADGSQSGLDISGDFSMQFWVKVESALGTEDAYVLQDKREGDTNGYSLRYANDAGTNRLYARWKNETNTSEGYINQTLVPGNWYHIIFTCNVDGPNGTIYVNGNGTALTMVTTAATSISNSSAAFSIGDTPAGSGNGFDGIIDEVGIWNRVLTAEEVSTLYNEGAGFHY